MNNLAASAITAIFPNLTYTVPLLGEYDFTKVVSAGVIFFGLTFLFWLLRTVVLIRIKRIASRTTTTFDDTLVGAVESIKAWAYTVVALFAAVQVFELPELVDFLSKGVFYFVVVLEAIAVATCFVDYFVKRYLQKGAEEGNEFDPAAATAAEMMTLMAKIILWVLGTIFVLSNMGIEVTSLIAGLGVGGIAVAFALQGVLGDLFASFSIYFDKPFRIGDYITVGGDSGTVEKIGIKTTRIRTLQGEELVVSNTELTTARVQNFKRMDSRRISSKFGITYGTPQEQVQEVPQIVSDIFAGIAGADLDRVHFATFADSALVFELVYYIDSSNYTEYLDKQQLFNFELMRIFADKGIEFAYPTQVVYTKTIN